MCGLKFIDCCWRTA